MLEAGLLLLLGIAVGAFGTLVGAGGGFVLVPILLLVYPDRDAATVTAMSLFVVFANATSGSLAYARQRRIDYRSAAWFALGTLPGALAGAIVVGYIPRRAFDFLFAAVVAVVAVYLSLPRGAQEVRTPVAGRGVVTRTLTDSAGHTFRYAYRLWQGVLISSAVGFMSSLLGIGGGIVHVPVMILLLHFPVHIATATSHLVLALMSFEGSVVHFVQGELGWDETFLQTIAIAAGAIPGAQIGARLAQRIHERMIVRGLASALLLISIRLWVAALVG
ncbi:MAG TPA: sulfite exporter TauE/SafE family protein [Dehalococcoidia bacterium]|nr:sulfite exporter TauE/SafE family protein [Dehalococcoidia bacterium]